MRKAVVLSHLLVMSALKEDAEISIMNDSREATSRDW